MVEGLGRLNVSNCYDSPNSQNPIGHEAEGTIAATYHCKSRTPTVNLSHGRLGDPPLAKVRARNESQSSSCTSPETTALEDISLNAVFLPWHTSHPMTFPQPLSRYFFFAAPLRS